MEGYRAGWYSQTLRQYWPIRIAEDKSRYHNEVVTNITDSPYLHVI